MKSISGITLVLALFMASIAADKANAQSIKGAPSIASYHAIGMCLDTYAQTGAVHLYPCHGGSNQAFRFVVGSYGQISLGNQQCLTASSNGAQLTASQCVNNSAQKWGFQPNGTLRNELGFCADIERGAKGAGARIIAWSCTGSSNQLWYPGVTSSSANIGLAAMANLRSNSGQAFLSSGGFSGGNIVASGGGNIVASGGGNIVASGGGNIVAGGAGNMISRNVSSIVSNHSTGIVAGGAGNLLPNNWNFFSGAGAGIVAGGAGN